MTLPWTSDATVPDVRVLTMTELVVTWRQNRSGVAGANTTLGIAAAEEIARRAEAEMRERRA